MVNVLTDYVFVNPIEETLSSKTTFPEIRRRHAHVLLEQPGKIKHVTVSEHICDLFDRMFRIQQNIFRFGHLYTVHVLVQRVAGIFPYVPFQSRKRNMMFLTQFSGIKGMV